MTKAAPALKPSRIVSLMKLTSAESRSAPATKLRAAISKAVNAAICARFARSPPAMPTTVVPTSSEMAEVGPMASWGEEPKSA